MNNGGLSTVAIGFEQQIWAAANTAAVLWQTFLIGAGLPCNYQL